MSENNVVENAETLSPEQQKESVRELAQMRARVYEQLIDAHIMSLTRVMISTNGVSQLQKRQAESALREAVKFAMDFGVSATGAKIRQKGTVYAKEVNNLAGILAQAQDNRMLLLADALQQAEEQVVDAEVPNEETVTSEVVNNE